jgi:hypothetical protein
MESSLAFQSLLSMGGVFADGDTWNFRYWDNSLVVMMWATGKSSKGKYVPMTTVQDGKKLILFIYTLQNNKNQLKIHKQTNIRAVRSVRLITSFSDG